MATQKIALSICNNFLLLVYLANFLSWYIIYFALALCPTLKIGYLWFVWFVTNFGLDLCNLFKSLADSWHSKPVGNFSAVKSLLRNRSQLLSRTSQPVFLFHTPSPHFSNIDHRLFCGPEILSWISPILPFSSVRECRNIKLEMCKKKHGSLNSDNQCNGLAVQ